MKPRRILAALFLALAVLGGLGFGIGRASRQRTIGYTDLSALASGGGFSRGSPIATARAVHVDGDRFVIETTSGEALAAVVDDRDARHAIVERFVAAGVPLDFEMREPSPATRAVSVLAPVLTVGLVGAAWLVLNRRKSHAHVAAHRSESTGIKVGFADVAGMDEVKEALTETVEFLKSPEHFGRLGGRAPRGVLLTGAPGTGKTLLARAVATEAGVPFLSASGSSFQEMFVGVGASRVRTLFTEARRAAPCIVYIDEIDAVGRARGRAGDSASGDHDQTLNQLLVEMDGFDHTSGIVVMASTNRPDILDPAIVRPGRFDRHVVVPLPDLRGRVEILGVHARPIELTDDVDLHHVARTTPGFSGAELANLLNEAAILAAREGADAVQGSHIDRARDRVLMGAERRGVLVDEEDRYATAVHEAGHVAVGVAAAHTDPVHKVSILPRGRALGVTQSMPDKDRLMYRRELLEDQLCMMLGGRAAEMEILGTMTAGAADDIERAASLARKMVAELGMSDLGPICLKDPHAPHSQALLDRVEETIRRLLDAELARARRIVADRRDEIARLVEQLLEHETLDAEAIRACFPGDARG
jgi:cell division protease FtsH